GGIRPLLGRGISGQRRKSRAIVEFQAGGQRGAAHQFDLRDQVGTAGAGGFAPRPREFRVGGGRVPAQVVVRETVERVLRVRLPGRHGRLAGAGSEQEYDGKGGK